MITASALPTELSLCHKSSAECPKTFRSTWTTSWSQFDPGNCRTAKFIAASLSVFLLDFKPVILNHRVAQNLVASLVNLLPRILRVFLGQFDFQVLAYPDRTNAGKTHMFQSALDSLALRI